VDEDLIINTTTRCPVCLCLDASGSMSQIIEGEFINTGRTEFNDGVNWNIVEGGISRLDKMEEGLNAFLDAIKEDSVARLSIELEIVTFSSEINEIVPFSTVDSISEIPEIQTQDATHIGEAINFCLKKLEQRKQSYIDNGVGYYQPILVVMSDGEDNGNPEVFKDACNRVHSLVNGRKLNCFTIGIDQESNMNKLNQISPAKRLNSVKFNEFFIWLSKSVQQISRSRAGEIISLTPTSSWENLTT
jgi:uncharacterized protein YegL